MHERQPEAGIARNVRFTLEEGAFLVHALSSGAAVADGSLADQVRAALAESPIATGPQQYWGFDADQLLLKLDRLTPAQQRALRAAIDLERRSDAGYDPIRIQGILDTWAISSGDHARRAELRRFLDSIGVPLQS